MIKPILITVITDKAVQGSKADDDLACCLSDECQGKLFNLKIRSYILLEKGQSQITCPYCGLHIANAEWVVTQPAPDMRSRREFEDMMKLIPFR